MAASDLDRLRIRLSLGTHEILYLRTNIITAYPRSVTSGWISYTGRYTVVCEKTKITAENANNEDSSAPSNFSASI